MFKKALLATTAVMGILVSANPASAGEGTEFNSFTDLSSWQVRLRSITIDPEESSKLNNGLSVDAHSQTVPEMDFTYFLTKNVAAELILATAMHEMEAGGVDLGHTKILPPTLTLQYHFAPEATFRPYLGVGLNYTFFYDTKKSSGLNRVTYKDGLGYALQAGADYMLDDNWGINIDIKKIYLETEANVNNGAIYGDVDLDPWILGFGITYKF